MDMFDGSAGGKLAMTDAEFRAVSVTLLLHGRQGLLGLPTGSVGIVLFAHWSGSNRLSPRNRFVAEALQRAAGSPPCCSTC